MSAWILSNAHINLLVNAAIQHNVPYAGKPVTVDYAQAVGQALWRFNHRSVNARYGERNRAPYFKFSLIEAPLDPARCAKAVACYEYQTCEFSGYNRSPAYRFAKAMTKALLRAAGIPDNDDAFYESEAWRNAPWAVDTHHVPQFFEERV